MANKLQQALYLGDRCRSCGLSVTDVLARRGSINRAFEFHHSEPDEKSEDYENLIRRKLCTEQLIELDKCVLLCSLCHPILHQQNATATITATATVMGRTVEQTLRGHVIHDYVDKTAKFVTNQRLKFTPYLVKVGDAPPRLELECELETSIGTYIRELRQTKRIRIFDVQSRQLVTRVDLRDDDTVYYAFDTQCPFVAGEFLGETTVFTRNGVALTSTGNVMRSGWILSFECPMAAFLESSPQTTDDLSSSAAPLLAGS